MTDPIDLPAGLLEELRAAYAEPPRPYHSWAHIERVLDLVREIAWSQPAEVWLAALARDAIARWLPDVKLDADRVAALIELTARHGRLTAADVDPEAALFLDCDTAVLAAPDEEFARYDAGIAAEWAAVVTPEQYRAGRKAFLQRLLDAPRIFLSDDFHERLDAAARVNLRFALKRLA